MIVNGHLGLHEGVTLPTLVPSALAPADSLNTHNMRYIGKVASMKMLICIGMSKYDT